MTHRISKTSKNLAVAKAAPSTEQVSKLAYSLVKDVMTKCLDSGKHYPGEWYAEGYKWHLTRSARHATNSLMLVDGLDKDSKGETALEHAQGAAIRAIMAMVCLKNRIK
jgi:hypothetical protein